MRIRSSSLVAASMLVNIDEIGQVADPHMNIPVVCTVCTMHFIVDKNACSIEL